jgi:hypothetical protein
MGKVGSGYLGTDTLKTSTAMVELVPTPPSTYPYGSYSLYRIAFLNDQDCTIILNGVTTLFIRAGQGFEIDSDDKGITSFVIKEAGITYNFIAGY